MELGGHGPRNPEEGIKRKFTGEASGRMNKSQSSRCSVPKGGTWKGSETVVTQRGCFFHVLH